MTAVLDDAGERLLLRRHRFIVDRWVWELPGGYVDDGEGPAAADAREVVEETGWRPRSIEFVMSCQPLIGNADFPQDLFLARGADRVGEPEAAEAAEVKWVPVDDVPGLIADGEILGAMTIIGRSKFCRGGQAFGYLGSELPDGRDAGLRAERSRHVTHVPYAAGRAEPALSRWRPR